MGRSVLLELVMALLGVLQFTGAVLDSSLGAVPKGPAAAPRRRTTTTRSSTLHGDRLSRRPASSPREAAGDARSTKRVGELTVSERIQKEAQDRARASKREQNARERERASADRGEEYLAPHRYSAEQQAGSAAASERLLDMDRVAEGDQLGEPGAPG